MSDQLFLILVRLPRLRLFGRTGYVPCTRHILLQCLEKARLNLYGKKKNAHLLRRWAVVSAGFTKRMEKSSSLVSDTNVIPNSIPWMSGSGCLTGTHRSGSDQDNSRIGSVDHTIAVDIAKLYNHRWFFGGCLYGPDYHIAYGQVDERISNGKRKRSSISCSVRQTDILSIQN